MASQKGQQHQSSLIRSLPWISGAALLGGAVFDYLGRSYVLLGAMLFLPLLDRSWALPRLPRTQSHIIAWLALLTVTVLPAVWTPGHITLVLTHLLFAALPEEWFFRAYFMMQVDHGWRSNLLASLLFSILHGLTRNWTTAAMVLAPSLFYGWLYQRSRDLPLLVLVHALSNVAFTVYISQR